MLQNKSILPPQLEKQQIQYLTNRKGLFELFDKMEAVRLFEMSQDPLQIDLENITFGPSHYTVTLANKEDLHYKIIYYCILYWIFQKKHDESSNKVYQKLLSFILQHSFSKHQLSLIHLAESQVKLYLIKFLYILQTAKAQRKLVLEELNNISQINTIFILLIKEMVLQQKLVFQKNARKIQNSIAEYLQLGFDLLSCQLFLMGGQFKVEIRQFQANCSFMIVREKPQEIKRIKEEFYLGQSAYFKDQDRKQLCEYLSFESTLSMRKLSAKILQKQTMKSIQWSQNQSQPEQCQVQIMKKKKDQEVQEDQCTKNNSEISTNNQPLQRQRLLNSNQLFEYTAKDQNCSPVIVNTPISCNTKPQSDPKLAQDTNTFTPSHKNHKQSFDSTQTSAFSLDISELAVSRSSKQISNQSLDKGTQNKLNRQRRTPSFILNRIKLKQSKTMLLQNQRNKKVDYNHPKITFTYNTK